MNSGRVVQLLTVAAKSGSICCAAVWLEKASALASSAIFRVDIFLPCPLMSDVSCGAVEAGTSIEKHDRLKRVRKQVSIVGWLLAMILSSRPSLDPDGHRPTTLLCGALARFSGALEKRRQAPSASLVRRPRIGGLLANSCP